jgi:hypothetical protein
MMTRPNIVGFEGEGSKTKTFEHLENFPSPGEQGRLGGGATKTIISTVGRDMDHQIGVHDKEGMNKEKDRSHPSDLSEKDRQLSDPGKVHGT